MKSPRCSLAVPPLTPAMYEGYSSRWPEDGELQSRITELMARIKKAYEVLGNVETRRVYDMPPTDEEARSTARIEQRPATQEPRPSNQPERSTVDVQQGNDGGKPRPRRNKPAPVPSTSSAGRNRRAADREGEEGGFQPDLRNPYEAAEKYYKRGRAAYERSDLQGAVHLLREAIKLDPDRSSYYYQLGLVLSTLSQARKEHKHHKGCHVTCRLGGFLARNQRVRRDAERNLLKAAELDPANPDIKLKLGMLYKEAALDQKAQQYFYEALTIDANCELAKLELGLDREQGPVKVIEPGKKKSRRRPGKK